MPHMADPNFAQTVTYIVEHSANGAMGLVINRPASAELADILEQLRPDIEPPTLCQHVPIYTGGPVQTDRGFVLHPIGPDLPGHRRTGRPGPVHVPRTCCSPSPTVKARRAA